MAEIRANNNATSIIIRMAASAGTKLAARGIEKTAAKSLAKVGLKEVASVAVSPWLLIADGVELVVS